MKLLVALLALFFFFPAQLMAQAMNWCVLPQGRDLYAVHAIDQNTAIAVGEQGSIYRTTDAGKTWNVQIGVPKQDLRSIFF
ncbi:hypothetical protein HUU05_01890, partial [candidate division KSB1 bacterium]|nr:hypothetical protein [candidate division KSB1 bacterium]